jgi:hypothetical protein
VFLGNIIEQNVFIKDVCNVFLRNNGKLEKVRFFSPPPIFALGEYQKRVAIS